MRLPALMYVAFAGCLAAPALAKSSVYLTLMGEPFRTNEAGEDPFEQWLKLADLDSDGAISSIEFRSDAKAFFEELDANDDKVIDADEMAEYEQMAPGRTRAAGGGAVLPSSRRPTVKSSAPVEEGQVAIASSGNVPSATRIHPGGGPIKYSEVPQPVAMADLNLDRRVTVDEFTKTANRRFANHDLDKDGRLTRKEFR